MYKEQASNLFKALAEPNRLKIVKLLINNDEICACDLLSIVDCKQATLSHHLKVLFDSGLLLSRKEGKNIIYSVNKVLYRELVLFMDDECDECRRIKHE